MPPKKIIEYTAYIIDCGKDINEKLEYFEKIYATKYFQQTKSSQDMQRVIFINSPKHESVKSINEWLFYKLDKLEIFKNEFGANEQNSQRSKETSAFLTGVKHAIKTFDEIQDTKNILIKKIVLISDLTTSIENNIEKINKIKTALKSNNITLYIVGVTNITIPKIKAHKEFQKLFTLKYLAENQALNSEQKENFSIIQRMSQQNILVTNYENGIDILFSYKSEIKDPYPWYVNMSIGTDLKIAVMCSRTTRSHQLIKFQPAPLTDDLSNYNTDKAWFDVNSHEEVPADDVVRGYYHHGKFITFTPEQEKELKLKTFSKCLSIFAFVDADEISKNLYILPDSMNMIKPDIRLGYDSDKGFKLLVAGLRTKKVVALAVRVYNNGLNPNFYVIFPCPEHNDNYLLMGQLPYAHQFQEQFVRGKTCKVETKDAELKMYTYGFLDEMTAGCFDNGQPIYPLPENLKLCRNRLRQYEFFANLNVNRDQSESPEMGVHPVLLKRADEYGELLAEQCGEKKEEK